MAKKALPSPEVLRQLLRYEPDTGKLFWLPRPAEMFATARAFGAWTSRMSGREAFTASDGRGYLVGRIFDVMYKSHRVIWAMQEGVWPELLIDHINGNRSDNRVCNLRQATSQQNGLNRGANKNSASGIKGVSWAGAQGKWQVQVSAYGVQRHLGYFADKNEAITARSAAIVKFHGEFGRT